MFACCFYGTHEDVKPKWRDLDFTCISLRVISVFVVFSAGMALVVHPQYTVYIEPLEPSQKPLGYYTYRLDFQCNGSYEIPQTWLDGKIDTSDFTDGCGGYGDFVQPTRGNRGDIRTSSTRQESMVVFDLAWTLIGSIIICVATCGCSCDPTQKYLRQKRATCGATVYLASYALWISVGFLIHAQEYRMRQDTWLCRPYHAEFDGFGTRTSLRVITENNRRESMQFTTVQQWNEVLEHAKHCDGMMLTDKDLDHHFEVYLKPSLQVSSYLDEKRQHVSSNAIHLVLYTFLVFGLITPGVCLCRQQKQRASPPVRNIVVQPAPDLHVPTPINAPQSNNSTPKLVFVEPTLVEQRIPSAPLVIPKSNDWIIPIQPLTPKLVVVITDQLSNDKLNQNQPVPDL